MKIFLPISEKLFTQKDETQPLTAVERISLEKVFSFSIEQLNFSITQLKDLQSYLSAFSQPILQKKQNIKDHLLKYSSNLAYIYTLKMLKRHFYINITDNSIENILQDIQKIYNNMLRAYQGLNGQMEFACKLFYGSEITEDDINEFSDKPTYVLIRRNHASPEEINATHAETLELSRWSFSYYENKKLVKSDIPLTTILSDKNYAWFQKFAKDRTINTGNNQSYLIKHDIALYHARQMNTAAHPICIADLPIKLQQENKVKGFVNDIDSQDFLDFNDPLNDEIIYIDYRLLPNTIRAAKTLIHESLHRYAWVKDHAYYFHLKKLKNNPSLVRDYPINLVANCSLSFSEETPNQNNLGALTIATDIAYVISKNKLYFIDKIKKQVKAFAINVTDLLKALNIENQTNTIILSYANLQKITTATGHDIKNDTAAAIDNADSYGYFVIDMHYLNESLSLKQKPNFFAHTRFHPLPSNDSVTKEAKTEKMLQ